MQAIPIVRRMSGTATPVRALPPDVIPVTLDELPVQAVEDTGAAARRARRPDNAVPAMVICWLMPAVPCARTGDPPRVP